MDAATRLEPSVEVAADWLLTAPWWHWSLGGGDGGARLRPVIQKYASPELVTDFLADPQHRLSFDPVGDRTQPPAWDPGSLLPVPVAAGTDLRKIYLPIHHRHYLVTVEVHCDRPGLPAVCPDSICEAGFVIRRRAADIPDSHLEQARIRMRALARARAGLGVLDRRLRQAAAAGRIGRARFDALADRRVTVAAAVDAQAAELRTWADQAGVGRRLEGWIPLAADADGRPVPVAAGARPLPGFGRWVPLDSDQPQGLTEVLHPLFPLAPDPTVTDHDGRGRTLYYGVLPSTSADLELLDEFTAAESRRQQRAPRFDDLSSYEVRCVVRRHDPRCPRRPGRRDCCGPLTWSAPSEAYRLANAMDARGSNHRPVTVRLPSRADLQRDALTIRGGGIRMASPDIDVTPGGGGAGFQICSFGIPLITIVATFVIKLFLPIVLLVFQLWFLLSFRLCIPPSVDLSAGAQADLAAKPPEFQADAAFLASWDAGHAPKDQIKPALDAADAALANGLGKAGMKPSGTPTAAPPDPADRFRLFRALAAESFQTFDDDLRYERRVERAQIPVPEASAS